MLPLMTQTDQVARWLATGMKQCYPGNLKLREKSLYNYLREIADNNGHKPILNIQPSLP